MHTFELLAPAGNFECLIAAVQNGADAVYLAGKSFGARSFADNFDNENLEKAVDYCHLRGVKIYVTVNTLVLDTEFEDLKKYLVFLSEIGTDAIIVQDMGVLRLASQIVPNLPIHASTQMTIYNQEGVEALKKLGVKRTVLSRELSLNEIQDISENTDMELEVFIHGALCMCYSGQCLLSSIIGGRSGNRGKCAQPCRLPYSINGKKEKKYFLSLKDLSGLEHLSGLAKAKVLSLKIEGRMKGPAYVAAVVKIYRKYIDTPQNVTFEDIEILDSIFNRGGLTDGYLTEKTGKNMFAVDKPDNPYLKGNSALEKELLYSVGNEKRKLKLRGNIVIKKNCTPVMTISYGGTAIEYFHDKLAEPAQKIALDVSSVISQLNKTGGTPFEFSEISAEVDEGLFLSAGEINKIRRNALSLFEKEYTASFKRKNTAMINSVERGITINDSEFVCEITTVKQLSAVKVFPFSKFYVPLHILEKNTKLTDDIKEKTIIVAPAILRGSSVKEFVSRTKKFLNNGYHGVLVHNISLIKEFKGYNVYGGFRLNIFNSMSLAYFSNLNAAELSPELTLRQIKEMKKTLPVQIMVYGRLPLVVSENCIIRNGNFCPCKGNNFITDRIGMRFPVIQDGESCRSVILNCKKTFMAFDMDKLKKAGANLFRLYFTDENADECKKVCDSFLSGYNYRPEDFTNGHFFKGVTN